MKKAISVFAIALLLIGMFSPIVSADITLTSEFVEPLKNRSFEDRDYSGDGVYESPPWQTNNGGWRELRGDVNGDGKVDIFDLSIVSMSYGYFRGEPGYNPDADLNDDGIVDIMDLALVASESGKEAKRIDGSYSWYTNGGGDYKMWQWLDSNTINVVKGKQVAFAFWFLPESITPDGLQNYARAEIWYSFTFENRWYQVQQNGDWVYPNETKWHSAFVTASLPSTTSSVKVIIHGKPDFKAWIDLTSLSITETKLAIKQQGDKEMKMKLAVNLFESKDYGMPIDPNRAFLGIAMSADIDTFEDWWFIYSIEYVELKMQLISGSFVRITNVTQSNDIDYVTDPDQTQEIENWWAVARNTAIKGILALGSLLIKDFGPYNIGKLLLSGTTFAGTTFLLKTYRSDADTPYTGDLGEYAKARINFLYATDFVRFANEGAIVELGWVPGSSCQVEVTATARYIALYKPTGFIYHFDTIAESILVTVSL